MSKSPEGQDIPIITDSFIFCFSKVTYRVIIIIIRRYLRYSGLFAPEFLNPVNCHRSFSRRGPTTRSPYFHDRTPCALTGGGSFDIQRLCGVT